MLFGERFRASTTATTLIVTLLLGANTTRAQGPARLAPAPEQLAAQDLERPILAPGLGRTPDVPNSLLEDPIGPSTSTIDIDQGTLGGSPMSVFSAERSSELEAEIERRIDTLSDPLERSFALERLGQTKLRSRELDQAHQILLQAAQEALVSPQGLRRDLRLLKVIDTLLDTASVQIIEGLSSTPPDALGSETGLPPALDVDSSSRLVQAQAEWKLAYELANAIRDINYRSEAITKAADNQSLGSETIARTGLRGSLLPLAPDLPRLDLLKYADNLLIEAAEQSASIPQRVWRDRSLVQVTSNAAESMQLARARAVASSIPDPAPRAEALTKTAERLVLLAYAVQAELPNYLDESWARFTSTLESSRISLENDLRLERMGSLDEAQFAFQRKQDALQDLFQSVVSLNQRVELLTQLVHNAGISRTQAYSAPFANVPMRRSEQLEAQLQRVLPRLATLKNQLRAQIRQVSSSIPQTIAKAREAGQRTLRDQDDPFREILRSLPASDDASWAELGADITLLADESVRIARNSLLPEATEVFNLAAQSISRINGDDPRSDTADLLISSLISTNRFHDARAAVRLLPDRERKLEALGDIAEAQGRRGLADSAYAWIDSEAPADSRALLMRRVEEGVLATVDENRLRRALSGISR